jgi:hypothetical protein
MPNLSYQTKFYIAAVILGVGCLLVVSGFAESQSGSIGAAFKLGGGVLLVAIGGPAFKYYRYRKNIPKSQAEIDIETHAILQNKKDKE